VFKIRGVKKTDTFIRKFIPHTFYGVSVNLFILTLLISMKAVALILTVSYLWLIFAWL